MATKKTAKKVSAATRLPKLVLIDGFWCFTKTAGNLRINVNTKTKVLATAEKRRAAFLAKLASIK